VREDVFRHDTITIEYCDEDFNVKTEVYNGLIARVIQHEYDHIEGILFTDHLSMLKKKLIGKKLDVISKKLDVRPEFIIRLLSQKGVIITIKQTLNFDELLAISEYIENRLHILERQKENKKYNRVSKIDKSTLSVFKGVWGEMKKYGISARELLVELGRKGMVGGQEDMIEDTAMTLAKARGLI
jgi:hypothetical protein